MISLIHPSRGRPEKSFNNSKEWTEKAGCDVELIVSIDVSDSESMRYQHFYKGMYVVEGVNSSVVEATNRAAKYAKGDILLYLSDDFKCPDNWGASIYQSVKDFGPVWLLKVDDCLQQFEVPVLTIPIMSRGLYERLGYFWHPGYRSMFVDEDLFWTAKKLGCLRNAQHLKFPHHHVSVGKAPDDETYKRSAANWDSGKSFYQSRKAAGFPL